MSYLRLREGIYMQKVILAFFMIVIFFTGCSQSNEINEGQSDSETDITQLSSQQTQDPTKSQPAKEAINTLIEVTSVQVVDADDKMVVAFEVKHIHRFQLKSLRSSVKQKIESMYPDNDVTVTTDQKIVHETKELEKSRKKLSKKELKKQLERIIKMDKEKT